MMVLRIERAIYWWYATAWFSRPVEGYRDFHVARLVNDMRDLPGIMVLWFGVMVPTLAVIFAVGWAFRIMGIPGALPVVAAFLGFLLPFAILVTLLVRYAAFTAAFDKEIVAERKRLSERRWFSPL